MEWMDAKILEAMFICQWKLVGAYARSPAYSRAPRECWADLLIARLALRVRWADRRHDRRQPAKVTVPSC